LPGGNAHLTAAARLQALEGSLHVTWEHLTPGPVAFAEPGRFRGAGGSRFLSESSQAVVREALPRCVLCPLLHPRMWVSVFCVGCTFFYMLFADGHQNRSKRGNKKSWETQGLMLRSVWVQTRFC